MKDEIKEILDILKTDMIHIRLFKEDREKLLNYITNLQEENERLKELNVCVGCNNNPDYKSRNKKAIEFIKEKGCYYSGDFDDILDLYDLNDLLNILNDGDEE